MPCVDQSRGYEYCRGSIYSGAVSDSRSKEWRVAYPATVIGRVRPADSGEENKE
jgi:hypothetical protein